MLKVIFFLILGVSLSFADEKIAPSIVGGRNTSPGQFPYMASLRGSFPGATHGCGGGIINQRWILTAAHCLILMQPAQLIAVVGSVRLSEGTTYGISRIVRHPRFIPNIIPFYSSNWHDIAIIKTTSEIIFTPFVQPIPLGRRFIIGNIDAVTAGFGAYDPSISINNLPPSFEMSENLQFIETRIITHNDCSRRAAMYAVLFPGDIIRPIIHPQSHICTVQPRGVGICFGDSGSMMVANGEAVGVVISGIRLCAQANAAPDIYTRISSYIRWIDSYIHDLS